MRHAGRNDGKRACARAHIACAGRDIGALSTSPIEANLAASWKQEVNRRLEAHKHRKGGSVAEPPAHEASHTAASRAAQSAAARVAARYAKAPSYSQMLAEEARSAVRAAEAASRAALDLQAAAESVLAGLEAASAAEHARAPEAFRVLSSERAFERAWEAHVEPARSALPLPAPTLPAEHEEPHSYGIRWDEDLPVRPAEPAIARTSHGPADFDHPAEAWWERDADAQHSFAEEAIESVEPLQPIHANLIEFPRELVATRKMRPRRAEVQYGVGPSDAQLSIFEVDPGSISVEPESAEMAIETAAPAWRGAEWSDIRLGEQPMVKPRAEIDLEEDAPPAPPVLELAPFGLRVMASLVDGALITGAFLAAAMVAATHVSQLPPLKGIEIGSALALVAIAALYHALFLTFAEGTLGMKYAHIALCTFDDDNPTAPQRRRRLVALILSLLPVGLGVAWAIFDEDHLTWHDRLSGTYLRRY
jgi:uncharacterized RDD family membrane protein YckC